MDLSERIARKLTELHDSGALDTTIDIDRVEIGPHERCQGGGLVESEGYYVPGEQFIEPPGGEERCEDCLGTGSDEVAKTLKSLVDQRDYLLGKLVEETVLTRFEAAGRAKPDEQEWDAARKWPLIRERHQMSQPDDADPLNGLMGDTSNGHYRGIARKQFR